MSKILILSPPCYTDADANGICAIKIRDALIELGNDVWLIGWTNKSTPQMNCGNRELCFNYTRMTNIGRIDSYLKSFHRLFSPVIDEKLTNKYFDFAKTVIENNDIEMVVAIYYPIETLACLARLKTAYPTLKYVSYELDSAIDGIHSGGRGDTYFDNAYIHWLKSLYKKIDLAIIMESHKECFFRCFNNIRTAICDIPVLCNKIGILREHEGINYTYTGVLNISYRSPLPVIAAFMCFPKDVNYKLHFYSMGNCEEIIDDCAKNDNRIIRHGYISKDELNSVYAESDVLISIGNSNSNSLPSKTIAYMNYGRPIIHFYSQQNDIAIKYLKQYPISLILNANDSAQDNNQLISDFIKKMLKVSVNYELIENLFVKNTPKYSAIVLCDFLKNE